LACLYVRSVNIPDLSWRWGVKFQTKLDQSAGLVEWLVGWLNYLGKKLWVVVDGAYIKKPFLKRALKAGAMVIGRLRRDAALWSVPKPVALDQRGRGRPRKYGAERISLAKRAGHAHGWERGTFTLYSKQILVCYKTFLATYKPASGLIRVVIVREEDGAWRAYMCTDPNETIGVILEAVADRSAIEQNFHDLKEVHGAGQQQLRNYWANIGAYHVSMWLHTLIELWAWPKRQKDLVDRSTSPWDDATRRPSHTDRRNALRLHSLQYDFQRQATATGLDRKIHWLWTRVLKLAV